MIDLAKIASHRFQRTRAPRLTRMIPDNDCRAQATRGTFDGAPGDVQLHGDLQLDQRRRGWPGCAWAEPGTSSPTLGAMVHQPDDTYLYYGWWVSKDKDGMPTAASAFTGTMGPAHC